MDNLYYIIGGIILGLILLILLKIYCNGGVCNIQKNLHGKVIFITGGNAGIGAEAAIKLGQMGATIVIGCRDVQKAQNVIDQIGSQQTYVIKLDLTDLSAVDACVEQFKTLNLDHIDVLINNAGIMAPVEYKETKQQLELQFGVNHIGHFYLTHRLLPFLKKAESGRVVNLSSTAHTMAKLNLDDLNCLQYAKDSLWSTKYTWTAYGNSKLCNILHGMEINQKYGLIGCSLHPGVVRTNLFDSFATSNCCKKTVWYLIYPFWWFFTKSPEQGAQTTLQCALLDDSNIVRGAYYSDCKVKSAKFVSVELAEQLWEKSIEIIRGIGYDI